MVFLWFSTQHLIWLCRLFFLSLRALGASIDGSGFDEGWIERGCMVQPQRDRFLKEII